MNDYKLINFIFILLLLFLFGYSFFFESIPDSFKVKSNCSNQILCKSRGLSRAFNKAFHGNFVAAKNFNSNYLNLFLFFTFQLFLRVILFSLSENFILKTKLVYIDITLSSLFFFYSIHFFIF